MKNQDRTYFVSQALGNLVNNDAGLEAIRSTAMPHMFELREPLWRDCKPRSPGVDKATYVEVVPSEFALRLHEKAGATIGVHASALGKAILAFSDEEFAASLLQGREL